MRKGKRPFQLLHLHPSISDGAEVFPCSWEDMFAQLVAVVWVRVHLSVQRNPSPSGKVRLLFGVVSNDVTYADLRPLNQYWEGSCRNEEDLQV